MDADAIRRTRNRPSATTPAIPASTANGVTTRKPMLGSMLKWSTGHVTGSQVQAAKADDLGAQAISKELGGIPVVENAAVAPGSARVILAGDYTGPGSSGVDPSLGNVDPAAAGSTDTGDAEPTPSPIITAGATDPACVN